MSDSRGVVQFVGVLAHRRTLGRMAQHPVFLKVRDVPNLPEEWIDCLEQRRLKLRVGQVTDKIQRP